MIKVREQLGSRFKKKTLLTDRTSSFAPYVIRTPALGALSLEREHIVALKHLTLWFLLGGECDNCMIAILVRTGQ